MSGDPAGALPEYRTAHGMWSRAPADRGRCRRILTKIADCRAAIGGLMHRSGDAAGALAELRAALPLCERVYPAGHRNIAHCIGEIGRALWAAGDGAGALAQLRRALEMQERNPGAASDAPLTRHSIGVTLQGLGRDADAVTELRAALRGYSITGQRHTVGAALASRVLADSLERIGEAEEAAALRRQADAVTQRLDAERAGGGGAGEEEEEEEAGQSGSGVSSGRSAAAEGGGAAAAADGTVSEASTAVLRREVGATATARLRKGGELEVGCARPGCGQDEPLLALRRDKMKKCAACHAAYYCSTKCQDEDRARHSAECGARGGKRPARARGPDGELYTKEEWGHEWWAAYTKQHWSPA